MSWKKKQNRKQWQPEPSFVAHFCENFVTNCTFCMLFDFRMVLKGSECFFCAEDWSSFCFSVVLTNLRILPLASTGPQRSALNLSGSIGRKVPKWNRATCKRNDATRTPPNAWYTNQVILTPLRYGSPMDFWRFSRTETISNDFCTNPKR